MKHFRINNGYIKYQIIGFVLMVWLGCFLRIHGMEQDCAFVQDQASVMAEPAMMNYLERSHACPMVLSRQTLSAGTVSNYGKDQGEKSSALYRDRVNGVCKERFSDGQRREGGVVPIHIVFSPSLHQTNDQGVTHSQQQLYEHNQMVEQVHRLMNEQKHIQEHTVEVMQRLLADQHTIHMQEQHTYQQQITEQVHCLINEIRQNAQQQQEALQRVMSEQHQATEQYCMNVQRQLNEQRQINEQALTTLQQMLNEQQQANVQRLASEQQLVQQQRLVNEQHQAALQRLISDQHQAIFASHQPIGSSGLFLSTHKGKIAFGCLLLGCALMYGQAQDKHTPDTLAHVDTHVSDDAQDSKNGWRVQLMRAAQHWLTNTRRSVHAFFKACMAIKHKHSKKNQELNQVLLQEIA